MSRPRYDWWPYVKGMIRRYPSLKREYEDLHNQPVTQSYSGMPNSGGDGRGLERIAIRELPSTKQREYEAVRRAIETTQKIENGRDRLRLIDLVLWRKKYTLRGAAYKVPCGEATAKRWHIDFIKLVAFYYGLLDGDKIDGPRIKEFGSSGSDSGSE